MKHEFASEKTQPNLIKAQASNAQQLRELVESVIVALNSDVTHSAQIAERLHAQLRERWGGRQIYFHRIGVCERAKRAAYVIEHWNGRNTRKIMLDTGLSQASIYRIAASHKAKDS